MDLKLTNAVDRYKLKAQCFLQLEKQGTANNNAANVRSSRDYCKLLALAFEMAFLHHADESQKGQNSCPRLQPCFISSGHVGVSQS